MWFIGVLVAIIIAAWLVHYYAERKVHGGIVLLVAFSWALGFSYFLVLPFDIADAMCRSCNAARRAEECLCYPSVAMNKLDDFIPLAYGLTMLNGYLMNDLLRSYLDSGEFTRRGRLRDALREAAYFYVPVLLLGLVLLFYMIAMRDLTFDSLRALGRGIINMFGLFLLIAFLGYGFVEVPRYLLNKANVDGMLRYYKFRVAVQSDSLQNARRKLEETLEVVQSTDAQLRCQTHSNLHEYMAAILRRCPRPMAGSSGAGGGGGAPATSSTHCASAMRPAAAGVAGALPGGGADSLGDVEACLAANATRLAAMREASAAGARTGGTDAAAGGASNGGADHGHGAAAHMGRTGALTVSPASERSASEKNLLPTSRKDLVSLHLRLKRVLAAEKRQRSMYEQSVRQALAYQDLFEPGGPVGVTPNFSNAGLATAGRQPGAANQVPLSQVRTSRWLSIVKPWLYRIAAMACGVLSVVLIWCEGTILFNGPPFDLNLSPLSYLYRFLGGSGGSLSVILALFVPLAYTALCTYFAMFQMKLCDGMTLYPNKHSDASSLLFNATYACRLGPPICFNFLKLLHEQDPTGIFAHRGHSATAITTHFTTNVFGSMDQVPLFSGDYFNNYAPLLIVVISGCTLLNLGSNLLSYCSVCCPCVAAPRFSFDDDFSDTRIDHGAQILMHERKAVADGVPLGTNLQLLSGATSDTEDPTQRRSRPARSRFNRLQEDRL